MTEVMPTAAIPASSTPWRMKRVSARSRSRWRERISASFSSAGPPVGDSRCGAVMSSSAFGAFSQFLVMVNVTGPTVAVSDTVGATSRPTGCQDFTARDLPLCFS